MNQAYNRCITLVFFLFFSAISLIAQSISLAGDVWAPYVMDPQTGRKGFMVDIAEAAFKKAGYRVNFKIVPWSRTLVEVEKGVFDGAVGIYFEQADEHKFIVPTEEIGISVNRFFVKKENGWRYNGPASVRNITFGVIADYDYGELNSYINQQKKTESSMVEIMAGNEALEKNIRKLMTNRISALVEDEIVVNYYLRKLGFFNDIKEAGIVPPSNRVAIAFTVKNKKSAEYSRILSEGVRQMRKSGELKAILDRYFVKDWK